MQHVLLPALLSFPSLRRNSSSCAKRSLFNPVFSLPGRVRDPAVRLNEAGEAELFFTYFRGNPAAMFTSDSPWKVSSSLSELMADAVH